MNEEEIIARIKNLRLIDDIFFNKVMEISRECLELVLRIILDIDDLHVEEVITQCDVPNVIYKGVRFDVLATAKDKIYDIEIQRSDEGAIPRRARYNSSMLDSRSLAKGVDYQKLPESYVIFITEHDVLKKNLPIYHIERMITETNESFNDASHIIYVNGENRDDSKLGRLMQDFFCRDPHKLNYKEIAECSIYLKESKEGVTFMSPVVEEIYNQGINKGLSVGEKKMIDVIKNLINAGMPIEFIKNVTGYNEEQIIEIIEQNQKN